MLKSGILNPDILSLIARVRHTNRLVICDWAFPFWPEIETVDISLTHGIPTVQQVFDLVAPNFEIGKIWQAEQFTKVNEQPVIDAFEKTLSQCPNAELIRLDHDDFKQSVVKGSIGIIRTADATPYANLVIESA